MCARVSVGERQAGGAHLLAGGLCGLSVQVGEGIAGIAGMAAMAAHWGARMSARTLVAEADGILYGFGDGHGGGGRGSLQWRAEVRLRALRW